MGTSESKPIEASDVKFSIYGKLHTINSEDVDPTTSLNSYLRNKLHLKGTKRMCLEGGCGSCIVAVRKKDPTFNKTITIAVNSCLVSVMSCHNWIIETVEGIGNPITQYHPIQKTLANFNGTQCGYCSPGMVMNMYALQKSKKLTMAEIENSFGGNICRCTGYRPILSAFKSLATDVNKDLIGTYPDIEDFGKCGATNCEETCELPCGEKQAVSFFVQLKQSKWVKVFNIQELLAELVLNSPKSYRLVAGNTGKGVFKISTPPDVWIDITDIPELTRFTVTPEKIILGANITLQNTHDLFLEIASKNTSNFWYLKNLADHIDLIANVPVRNIGTLAGNLMLKHEHHEFQSDVFLILETVGAVLTIVDPDGIEIEITPKDFLNFNMDRKLLKLITLKGINQHTHKFQSYKIMSRAQNTIANINAGFLFKFTNNRICSATVVYGNINPTFVRATKTEQYLIGKDLFENTVIQIALDHLSSEINPNEAPTQPSSKYRKQLALSLFYKCVLSMAPSSKLSKPNQSGADILIRPVSSGTQEYGTNRSMYPITQPIPKIEALAQTSGQAEYIDDMGILENQLFAAFVLSETAPGSTIKKIDPTKALAAPNIVAFFDKDDIPGDNSFMNLKKFKQKEEIFCSGKILYYHQPIGMIVGKSEEDVFKAVPLVKVEYTPSTSKLYFTAKEIVEKKIQEKITPQFEYNVSPKRTGNDIKHTINGTFYVGSQYHFYMETQVCKVVPTEDGLNVYPSTQSIYMSQGAISSMLNIPTNRVNLFVRRCGGAFGGKSTRNSLVSCATALAAWKLNKPVSMRMSLENNMEVIGKRAPFYATYEVAVNDKGVIQYLKSDLYSDSGQGENENFRLAFLHHLLLGNYDTDTYDLRVHVTTSDTPANTWTRAPGSTEAMGFLEAVNEHIAYILKLDPLEVRISNMKQGVELLKYVKDIKEWADIDARKTAIKDFNSQNRWKKKGISVVPMAFELIMMGPYPAVVTIYHNDGSVTIKHSGIEMGQGINTRVVQTCAYKLGLPIDQIVVMQNDSFISGNADGTQGSVTTESVCYAVIQACDKLLKRIEPYRKKMPKASWAELINACHTDSVSLTAVGMYSKNSPNIPESYVVYGICATEVLVDILTGQHIITRVDLVEDTGDSISPLVDIGQVEGAFIMGLGYFTTEEIIMDKNGKVLSNNTLTYKPPGAKDIPVDFRVKFPKNNPFAQGILKSKAMAEPPLCLSISVPLAIRNAVASARNSADCTKFNWFLFDGPTTIEQTFMNCLNDAKQYIL